ncbi:MAG: excinuclease ABC subunit C, partial [Planctomycetes bacterium]|nr:excinuclease ABC subunit C [Planctomycetota bacterium]
ALKLENIPRRMECFDISHFQGEEIVGSRVTFIDGAPSKDHYRRYRLKEVTSNDDFASMDEVLTRRLERAVSENDLPDVIVVDGGPAQLARVQQVFEKLNIIGVDLVGLAKARDKSGPAHVTNYRGDRSQRVTLERVFILGASEPIVLKQDSAEMYMLMRLRDEAHRFAITYNRERRRKQALVSGLDAIAGVGPKRKRALIKHFGSPAQVKQASIEQLRLVPGITDKLARQIRAHFDAQD